MLDKTIADTFAASDPPLRGPAPDEDPLATMGAKSFVTNEFSGFKVTLGVQG